MCGPDLTEYASRTIGVLTPCCADDDDNDDDDDDARGCDRSL